MTKAIRAGLLRAIVIMACLCVIPFANYVISGTPTPATIDVPASVPAPAEPDRLSSLVRSGDCWTGGEGHPYPDTVVVKHKGGYLWLGQAKVDWLISDFSRIDNSVAAFCKLR